MRCGERKRICSGAEHVITRTTLHEQHRDSSLRKIEVCAAIQLIKNAGILASFPTKNDGMRNTHYPIVEQKARTNASAPYFLQRRRQN
jgi:hypothetical protein